MEHGTIGHFVKKGYSEKMSYRNYLAFTIMYHCMKLSLSYVKLQGLSIPLLSNMRTRHLRYLEEEDNSLK